MIFSSAARTNAIFNPGATAVRIVLLIPFIDKMVKVIEPPHDPMDVPPRT